MALAFAARDHVVVGCGRSAEALESLRSEIGPPSRFDAVDVSRDAQVGSWAASVLESHGPPDLLVNNAALINQNSVLWEVPREEFSNVIDVNVKGTFHVIRHFLPAMEDRVRGVIVNFSSGWGRVTDPEVAPYCATKWAVEGMTRALAQEVGPGLAAVPLNPGIIRTEMLEQSLGGEAAGFPGPEDWAERAVPFLLSLGPEHNGLPLTVP